MTVHARITWLQHLHTRIALLQQGQRTIFNMNTLGVTMSGLPSVKQ